MCSAPAQDRRDASHQHTCLRAWIPERAFRTPERLRAANISLYILHIKGARVALVRA
ncbi:hypothetical protein D4764_04G0003980 [Takifugu flavidus]|uniref:Uncharacterized protein n=1 Tax=Takifugu flavidus TaxID=433684 RepID=A0A5C6N609_9TELE|nr:hypothetical protein D4764_04G0003980 [Takifugu flavidus]